MEKISDGDDDPDLVLFLEAVRETNKDSGDDQLKTEIEVLKSQLSKLSKKYNEAIISSRKQSDIIEKTHKEKIQLKKELIESNFQKKQAELQLSNIQDDMRGLRNELKSKGQMILSLEKDRRKLVIELNKIDKNRDQHQDHEGKRIRSISADRLHERRKDYGRQLLKRGMSAAYNASKSPAADHKNRGRSPPEDPNDGSETDFEKVLLLQKLLLAKTKILTEREVLIENLQKRNQDLSQNVSRLKRSRFLAEELTETRHKLTLKNKQLEAVKSQMDKYKTELSEVKLEVKKLRDRLNEYYSERKNLLSPN